MPMLAFLIFSSIMYLILPDSTFSRAIRITSGVIALILIPGYCIMHAFLNHYEPVEKFGFSLVCGLAIQIFIVLILYSIGSTFLYKQTNFGLAIIVLTFSFILMLLIAQILKKQYLEEINTISQIEKIKASLRNNSFLLVMLIFSLIIRLYYQSFIHAPSTDGALYLDFARNIATTGQFTSKSVGSASPIFLKNYFGFSTHLFACFTMAIFFQIGGVSFSSAKLMTVFAGFLVVFLIYKIAREFFSNSVAIIASGVASFHPLLLLYSSVIYGPEILATLFMLSAFYFFLMSLKSNLKRSRIYAIFAGLFAFLTLGAAGYIFLALLIAIFSLFAFFTVKDHTRFKILKSFLFAIVLMIGLLFAINKLIFEPFAATSTYYLIVFWAIPIFFAIILFKGRDDKWISCVSYTFATVYIFSLFTAVRAYYISQVVPRQYLIHGPLEPIEHGTLGYAEMLISQLSRFPYLYSAFWQLANESLTPAILLLSLLSFAKFSKWKENLSIFSYPFFFSLAVTLLGSSYLIEPNWYIYSKIMLSIIPFFTILSASTISLLVSSTSDLRTFLHTGKRYRSSISKFLTGLIILIVLLPHYSPLYSKSISYMDDKHNYSFGIGLYEYYKPAIEWIRSNTPLDTVLMSRKPDEFAWYTNRTTFFPLNPYASKYEDYFNVNTTLLMKVIHRYGVNYLIVDYYNFYDAYKDLNYLYLDPSEAPYGFDLAFQYNFTDHYKLTTSVLIYNVTLIASVGEPIANLNSENLNILETEKFSVEKAYEDRPYDIFYPRIIDDKEATSGKTTMWITQNPDAVNKQEVSLKLKGYGCFTVGVRLRSSYNYTDKDYDTGLSILFNGMWVGGITGKFTSAYEIYLIGTIFIDGEGTLSIVHTHHDGGYWAWTYVDYVELAPTKTEK